MEMVRDTLYGNFAEKESKLKALHQNEAEAMTDVEQRATERLAEPEHFGNRHERRRQAAIEGKIESLRSKLERA